MTKFQTVLLCCSALLARVAAAEEPTTLRVNWAKPPQGARFVSEPRIVEQAGLKCVSFTNLRQYVEIPGAKVFDEAKSATVGLWVKPQRVGEQYFLSRGTVETGPNGERMFPPRENWVNFLLGTDQRGFLLGTIHGNGSMPFPLVSLDEVPANQWSLLIAVKTAEGYQKLYRNGVLVFSDDDSAWSPVVRKFTDLAEGEPIRLAVPYGGMLGEVSIAGREFTEKEIANEFETGREKYSPAIPPTPVLRREMNAHNDDSWSKRGPALSERTWPEHRQRIDKAMKDIFGAPPAERLRSEHLEHGEVDCGTYLRRKCSIEVHYDDRMPFYLLIPKRVLREKRKAPVIICFYGTTSGAGKETTVGLSGSEPGSRPQKNRGFAVDFAEAGLVAVAADYLRDGERIKPGRRPYDTSDFYAQFPDWSIHGKDAFDTSRLIDHLVTLDFVDAERIGMVGHSYGGHSTLFTAAMEPRIKAAWANGPVSDFLGHGMHWASPKGAGSSQSLPAMRPYILDHTQRIPLEFFEITARIAPRPLVVAQAVGEWRPREEENYAATRAVYDLLGAGDCVNYLWFPGDHDFPPIARKTAVEFFRERLGSD